MSSTATAHVPAWRRLGLKLKNAKDQPYEAAGAQEASNLSPTESRKRRKLSPPSGEQFEDDKVEEKETGDKQIVLQTDRTSVKSADPGQRSEVNASALIKGAPEIPKKHRQRKSVSFTPDTKAEDGSGPINAYDSWSLDENGVPEVGEAANTSTIATESGPGRQKVKRKKSKSTLLANQPASPDEKEPRSNQPSAESLAPISPLLNYLNTYQNSRAEWKFSKAKQNQLFKHLFDISKIPATYDEALIAYITGLESQAARQKLRERALELREKDVKDGVEPSQREDDRDVDMDLADKSVYGVDRTASNPDGQRNGHDQKSTDEERHRAAYEYALRRHLKLVKHNLLEQEENDLQLSEEWLERLTKRQRGEKLLQALGEKPVETVWTPIRVEKGADYAIERNIEDSAQPGKRKRKRKRRTAMPIDDSSSDETSSSDEDEAIRELGAKMAKASDKKLANALNESLGKPVESDSSGDSSSSSSEGEDDEGSSSSESDGGSSTSTGDSSSDESEYKSTT